jgi:proteasome lid subunit RPN8/RPN11
MIKIKNRRGLEKHLLAASPAEGCALILKSGQWIGCDPGTEHTFSIPLELTLKHSRDIAGVAHSHVGVSWRNNAPSIEDRRRQLATDVPWIIFLVDEGVVRESYCFRGSECSDNQYRPGLTDEVSVVEDHFELPWAERQDPIDLLKICENLILVGGFRAVAEIREESIVLCGEDPLKGPTHLGVLLSDNKFIYREPYGDLITSEGIPFPALHKVLVRS